MRINPIQQRQSYKQKINPSFTALNSIRYSEGFCPSVDKKQALKVKAFLDNPAFKDFCEKFDVEAVFHHLVPRIFKDLSPCDFVTLYFKECSEKPKNLFKKCIGFFREDKRKVYSIKFDLDNINTISKFTIDNEISKEMEYLKGCIDK